MDIILLIFGVVLASVWLGVVLVGPPYVPTLSHDLQVLFAELKLTKNDHFVDLGAGDGKVIVHAACHGAAVSGVEINPFLALIAWFRLRRYKGRVTLGNMWNYHLPNDTTHVFIFAAGAFMNKLEHYIRLQAGQGRKFWLICYGFQLPGVPVKKTIGAFHLYRISL